MAEALKQQVTAGRIVRYVNELGEERVAIVVDVLNDTTVNLYVFGRNGLDWTGGVDVVLYDTDPGLVRRWHWPPRG